jgi:lysophospholipase L1-like esterase
MTSAQLVLAPALAAFLASGFSYAAEAPLKYDFGSGAIPPEYTRVRPDAVFSAETGFGFEPGGTVESIDRANGGGADPLRSDFVTAAQPFYFSVALPEGNYRVTLMLGDPLGASDTTVKAELRRLMLEKVQTTEGEFAVRSFVVNLRRPQIAGADPAANEVKLKARERAEEAWAWDGKLTLEFNGPRPCLAALEIAEVPELPTVFLLGDSTVADQPREPFASWGQMFTRFFKPDIAIANHSESGESLASAIAERRLDKILSIVRPGDYVFLQFGHNDMKAVDVATYKANLKKHTAALREKKAAVVLVTQMHRRTFDTAGKITNSHREYPDAVREVAREENLPLIDLHAMSQPFYEALGPEKSKLAFKEGDGTHHNAYGAYVLAKAVVEGVRQAKLPLAKHIVDDFGPFDPAKPDPLETFSLARSPTAIGVKPDGS